LKRAVFLDRDGVINEPSWDRTDRRHESPIYARDVALAEGAVEALRALAAVDYLTIVASNQPAAAKGKATLGDLRAVHERVVELLAAAGIELDDWRYCLHHPDAVDPALQGACDCRKPAPGLLLAAAAKHDLDLRASWMVGDSDRAGCRTVLVEHALSHHRRPGGATPHVVVRNLAAAAAFIIDSDRATLANS
jgi:D-glycero-D-manno-heptose 1,7-bisphosphate phosphatase